ncbi:G-type lectin S-receptor-like serine/threonine-protein kinase At4g27290 isoform X1 [Lactuca sativa]|uniref:G-type lectin S-receptor-like serine/threonine-protein kinase At4g27290 isoform X1 n=1 Tax=Lactuca sativa TaxID=4236 RepID=UPI000CD9D18C|nr:G-type lectin S-receptor-like serine/threonine-protein kinase At4g27290 isoform X1 [Lactuca sativa]
MELYHTVLVLLYCNVFFFLSCSAALDSTVSANQQIKDGNTIVSYGETYELGFFSPRKSKNRYLGIWYKKISPCTVVWVANRHTPITDASGVFEVTTDGILLIHSGGGTGNRSVIWSSNFTVLSVNPMAQLLDTGNLVVWDESSTKESPLWQSFDYPGDTLLPGMKFGKDLITGRERFLTSWKSPNDPSRGLYKFWVDTNGYPQIFLGEGGRETLRLGPWNGVGFQGVPVDNMNPIYSTEFVVNQKEIYYRYKLKSTTIQRLLLVWDGMGRRLQWIKRTQEWVEYANIVVDACSRYGPCGPFGSCRMKSSLPCSCLEGFEPKVPEEWKAGDWSSGCQRRKPLDFRTPDFFHKISGVVFPDTRRSSYNKSMSLGECEMACRRDCSCTAYANLDIRNGGSGCLLWFNELMDIREYDDDQQLYIRMSTFQLTAESQFSFNKKKGVLAVVLSVSIAALLLFAVAYACRKKVKRLNKKGRGSRAPTLDKDHTSVQMENFDELPFFSLHKIVEATNNFNINNKIGEGGFGPVYKGVLENEQVIAVKRLSETSQQGLDEFQNEVICIAKLQHRNLVKLLGYCIHGNERILIYEYMDNKSLDSFLFDETNGSMLDWPQRFRIIHGIARGILYLHQDSRLQIIHRDLKAGNILLDSEMNPKISDFGLARKFVGQDAMAKTKKVVGTHGYISPEYAVHGRFSIKSDVFSFGVVVLEIVSGKKNRGFSHEAHSDNLLGHAWRLYKEDKSIELLSASVRNSSVVSEVLRSIHVGLLCVQHHAEDRPTMLSVVLMLISEGVLPPPKQPAFFIDESYREVDTVSSHEEYTITLLHAR